MESNSVQAFSLAFVLIDLCYTPLAPKRVNGKFVVTFLFSF